MEERYKSNLGICAGSLMLKWNLLDTHIQRHIINIKEGDDVNVFINLECVLRNLTFQKGLSTIVQFHKQNVVLELESSILNLMANYRMYFQKLKCNAKLYFYFTGLNIIDQQMKVYNEYYRNFYHNRYMINPQFKLMGELIDSIIVPELELILSYCKDCYFIKSKTFDGSVIPLVISNLSSRKNIIISGDIFDTLYMFNPNFMVIYIKRRFQHFSVSSTVGEVIRTVIKDESPFDASIFESEMYYRLLLSIKGSKIRNIKSAKGFGYGKFMNILKQGIKNGVVLRDFGSLDSIIQLFPIDYRNDIKSAFQCTSIDTQYQLLSDSDIEYIKSQIVDKADNDSLEALNNRRFSEYPINLPGLIG